MSGIGLNLILSLGLFACGSAGATAKAVIEEGVRTSEPAQPHIEVLQAETSEPNQPVAQSGQPPLQIPASQPAAAEPNQAAQVIQKTEQLQRQIKMMQVTAMEPSPPAQSASLLEMVQQLQSLQLPADTAGVKTVAEAPGKTDTNQTLQTQPISQTPVEPAQTGLARLDQVVSPLNAIAAADALYRVKDYVRAMRFYEAMIQNKDSNVTHRQWAMYQSANCMRYQDADRAVELYNRLIAEFPNSPWSSAALVQRKNLEWLKKNRAELEQRMTVYDPNTL